MPKIKIPSWAQSYRIGFLVKGTIEERVEIVIGLIGSGAAEMSQDDKFLGSFLVDHGAKTCIALPREVMEYMIAHDLIEYQPLN